MKEGSASQRVHLLERRSFLARAQLMSRIQQEAIRAGSELLKGRWRVSALRKAIFGERGQRGRIWIDDAVRAGPALAPSSSAGSERAHQGRVHLDQISSRGLGLILLQCQRVP